MTKTKTTMMPRALVLASLIAAAIATPACHGHDDAAAVQVVAGAPAGDVTEVAGDVKATRDGKTRALGKGDIVSGDDVIATGADGRVTIVLRHNQVAWSLGSNQQKKVADSAAWAAAKGASGEVVSDDRSSAAGRHAERMAADTVATSGGGGPTDDPKRAKSDEQQARDDAERERAKAQLEQLQKEQADDSERLAAAKAAADKAERLKGVRISKECLDNPLAKGCDDGDAKPKGVGAADDSEVEGAIDPTAIRRVMQAHAHDFTRCYEVLLKTAPTAAGKIRLHMTIGARGTVTKVELDSDAPLAPMNDCVRAATMKLRFPAPRDTIEIMYPLVFASTN